MDVEGLLSDTEQLDKRGSRKLLISEHAHARAQKRMIAFNEIASAVKNGTQEPADNGAWKFRFGGVVVIVDCDLSVVLTVYPEPGYGINVEKRKITSSMQKQHDQDKRKLRDRSAWTSHTVAIVDQSGSMRAVDIQDNITRSDLVWLNLAVTIVSGALERGERKATDVLSVVVMKDDSEMMVLYEPYDWLLYNRLIDLMRHSLPGTGGRYIPALDQAETLLAMNRSRRCALGLLFFSDGRPSDPKPPHSLPGMMGHTELVTERVRKLAKVCGKRLTVWCLAIGVPREDDFIVLNAMVTTAAEYECPAYFKPACLSSGVLSTALRSLTTSMSSTMTTIGAADNPGNGLEYREFEKMPVREVGASFVSDTWEVVKLKQDIFRDRWGNWKFGSTIVRTDWTSDGGWKTNRCVLQDPRADGLAFETRWFGEGKERLAKEMREVITSTGRLVGPRLVAKASILKNDDESIDHDKEFHKRFLKTQIKSQRLADLFNEALEKAPDLDEATPRIQFVQCWVYMINTRHQEAGGRKGFLVEPMLDIKRFEYKKFNDNAGRVESGGLLIAALPAIQEVSEDEESDHEEFDTIPVESKFWRFHDAFSRDKIPQAFSCFTHWISRRQLLVCDLQGILNTELKPPMFQLTDPAIHSNKTHSDARERYGRTDRGKEGIDDFLRSHKCSPLCRILRTRHIRNKESLQQSWRPLNPQLQTENQVSASPKR